MRVSFEDAQRSYDNEGPEDYEFELPQEAESEAEE